MSEIRDLITVRDIALGDHVVISGVLPHGGITTTLVVHDEGTTTFGWVDRILVLNDEGAATLEASAITIELPSHALVSIRRRPA
jgi:hypothetical protein